MNNRIELIEKKINNLRKKKRDIQKKNIEALSRLIVKCGLEEIDKATLAGALLSVTNADEEKKEGWRLAGEKFLSPKRASSLKQAV